MYVKNQVVRFRIGKESFGVNIENVQEIVTLPEITKIPDAPDFLEGVINLRGRIISVIDLRKRLGITNVSADKKNRILVTEVNGKFAGLIVDEVSEVIKLNTDDIEPPPEIVHSIGVEYITGIGKLPDGIIILLDLSKVITAEDIGTIHAVSEITKSFGEQEAKNLPGF